MQSSPSGPSLVCLMIRDLYRNHALQVLPFSLSLSPESCERIESQLLESLRKPCCQSPAQIDTYSRPPYSTIGIGVSLLLNPFLGFGVLFSSLLGILPYWAPWLLCPPILPPRERPEMPREMDVGCAVEGGRGVARLKTDRLCELNDSREMLEGSSSLIRLRWLMLLLVVLREELAAP